MKMNIWSDDSIEEAMAELPDVTGSSAEKRELKKMTFPADDVVASADVASQTTSQSTVSTFSAISQRSQSHLLNLTTTPATSFGSAASDLDSQGSVFST
ncbi:Rad2 nuclease, partial [Cryomyces antarcticus]